MSPEVLAIVGIVIGIILVLFIISLVKSYFGKPVRGVLRVPQGKERVEVILCDDTVLRPFKYGQVLDVQVLPGKHTIRNTRKGKRYTGRAALAYKNTPIGFADSSSRYVQALAKLADEHKKTMVGMAVISIDEQGEPIAEVYLPDASWFKRAWKSATEQPRKRSYLAKPSAQPQSPHE